MGHVQIMYFWNSLNANMCLKIMSIEKYNDTIAPGNGNRKGPSLNCTESGHIGLS